MVENEERALRLNLGCGDDIQPGYVNHDFARHRPEVDVVHDLRVLPWPWADESAETIRLLDVLEHLPQAVPIIDECWRVLRPGGVLHLRVPHYQSENAWLDPTHQRPFHLDSFDYFDPDTTWGAKYGFYTQRKWKLGSKRLEHGNVVVFMHARKGAGDLTRGWLPHTEEERLYQAGVEVADLVPRWASFILVGGERWESGEPFKGDRCIPFLERDGQYWGKPEDDETAIRELERLRRSGASFVVFAWPAFWWLDCYPRLNDHLRTRYRSVLENDRVMVFDLRGGGEDSTDLTGVVRPSAAAARERWRRAGDLRGFERRVYSQNGEDGILEEILRRVGVETRFFVEFGVESGAQCNCARLVFEEGWKGLFLEGDPAWYEQLRARYREQDGVTCVRAWVSPENIEDLLAAGRVPPSFDVLSIDIDGNDYWVWSAIKRWHPRVVVIEYNAGHPPPQKWVMKENPNHRWDGTDYFGASLASLTLLGRQKGYALVATDSAGVNAFFVREDLVAQGAFLDAAAHYHYSPPRYGATGCGHPPGQGPFVEI